MAHFFSVLLGLLAACPVTAQSVEIYRKKGTWAKTMLASRNALLASRPASSFKPYISPVLRGGQAPVHFSVDVSELVSVWLIATDAGNGIGLDHSVWGDPVLIGKDGSRVSLTRLKPVSAKVGWNRFRHDRNERNQPIRVAGHKFEHALFAHAVSLVNYRLARKYKRFEAWVGIDDAVTRGGSVQFKVLGRLDASTAVRMVWSKIQEDFPAEGARLKKDLRGKDILEWFTSGRANVDAALIRKVLSGLGNSGAALAQELDALCQAKVSPLDERWLGLYARAARMRDAKVEVKGAFELARKTLAFVQKSTPRPALAKELAAVEARFQGAANQPGTEWPALLAQVKALRRRIIFSHPLLNFDRLLINKRPPPAYSHQCDQYLGRHSRAGPGLVVLDSWKDHPKEKVLLEGKLPKGTAHHPDLSFDGRHVLFAFCDHTEKRKERRRFFIYEAAVDGSEVRQLTGTLADPLEGEGGRRTILIEDWDPCYLPDGGIAFVSTRSQNKGRCHGGRYVPSYLLYRMNHDGTGLRQLSFGESNEWEPSVLPDGRLIYCRWDYINRHDTIFQSLWVTRPDGQATEHYYGNYTRNPCMTSEAVAIPHSRKVVAIAAAHHSYTAGSVIVIDPYRGRDGLEPITRVTPEVRFPETEGFSKVGAYDTPFPLSENLFLVAYSPHPLVHQGQVQEANAYGIYLIDSLGGRELIYRDPDTSCFAPIPVRPRAVPPALAATASTSSKQTGKFYVENVYRSTQAVPSGTIKRLRINRIIGQPTIAVPERGRAQNEIVKAIVGTVPVADDGSAAFEAPAGVPLQFQLLDKHGMAVMTMRSFVYLQPGETMSCVGCHESRSAAPTLAREPSSSRFRLPTPPAGPHYEGGFSFPRTVQPVLDRYCIQCHGLGKTGGNINLLGSPKWSRAKERGQASLLASESFDALVSGKGLVKVALRNREGAFSRPDDYFARAGTLARMLIEGHGGRVRLDPDDFQRIVDWLDLNCQYFGDYSFNRPEWRKPSPEGEKALRASIQERFGSEVAKQPFAALVNVALPEESRILKAPLALAAGGWAQFPEHAYTSAADPKYRKMRQLVEKSIQPLKTHDIAGTCAQKRCKCRSCWVREAEQEYRQKLVANSSHRTARTPPAVPKK